MSDLPQTRSKRPPSPSAPSFAWNAARSTARKTSRPNHNISSTIRDDIADLDEQGLRDLVHQLVNFHPPSRERIAEILPTIKRASPAIVKSTESKYFEKQVDSCRYLLSDQEWTRHPTVAKLTCCSIIWTAVQHEFIIIMKSVRACKAYETAPQCQCSKGEYFVDAAIAILDIALLLFKRRRRTARKDHQLDWWCACVCQVCEGCDSEDDNRITCYVHDCFDDFTTVWDVIWPLEEQHPDGEVPMEDEDSVKKEWLAAICYATPDGSPHPLSNVLSKYIDLPSLVPTPGPNAGHDSALDRWLYDQMSIVCESVSRGVMPKRATSPVPNVAGLSL